jgi:hypothetical protein
LSAGISESAFPTIGIARSSLSWVVIEISFHTLPQNNCWRDLEIQRRTTGLCQFPLLTSIVHPFLAFAVFARPQTAQIGNLCYFPVWLCFSPSGLLAQYWTYLNARLIWMLDAFEQDLPCLPW